MAERDLLFELTRRYTEPQRHYHTLHHIAEMLMLGRDKGLTPEQIWAVWFHDAVYDPGSATNERDSAALATQRLPAIHMPAAMVATVAHIVRDTQDHVPTIDSAAAVIDLDLASLAAPWEVFVRNRENIRREYAHVSDADFAAGTAAFMEKMLQRERLFWTDWGRELEAGARANLERVLRDAD